MSTITHTPPSPEHIALLRARPSYQLPEQQAIIDRLAAGEIGTEETLQLLLDDVLARAQQVQRARQARETLPAARQELEQLATDRSREAQQMQQNRFQDEPTINDDDVATPAVAAPSSNGLVISAQGVTVGPVIYNGEKPAPGELAGASGSWEAPPPVVAAPATASSGALFDLDGDEPNDPGAEAARWNAEDEDR